MRLSRLHPSGCSISAAGVALALLLSGCAHSVHQVHVSEVSRIPSSGAGTIVRSESQQFAVLGLVQETNYVEQAYTGLLRQCEGRAIQGVSTQFMTSLGFFSWTNKVLMQGYCESR